MKLNFDVVIVSAFGRGHWLASEMARKGLQTALIDISDKLGRWAPEDWEGPFGFFKTERMKSTQVERLLEDDFPEAVTQGFTVWTQRGPIETKGPLTLLQLQNWGLRYELVQNPQLLWNGRDNPPFSESWLARLTALWNSSVFQGHEEKPAFFPNASLMSSFFVRQATRPGFERSLGWCKYNGVHIFEKSDLRDVSFIDAKNIEGLEILSQVSGLVKASHVVWSLTGHETHYLSDSVFKKLYHNENVIEPDWSWMRYRLRLSPSAERDVLPVHFLMVGDPHLPWSHENFCVVQRTFSPDDFDVWLRLPCLNRFSRPYLEEKGLALVKEFEKRMPSARAMLQEYPQEYHYTYHEMGPPRFPLLSQQQRASIARKPFANLHFDSSETWEQLDWCGQLTTQASIESELIQWWRQKQDREELQT